MIGHPKQALWLPFEADVNDKSKNAYTGTNTGCTLVAGSGGNRLQFNGATNNVTYGAAADLNFERTEKVSFSFKLKVPASFLSLSNTTYSLFQRVNASGTTGWIVYGTFGTTSSTVLLALSNFWGTNFSIGRMATTAIADDNEHHIGTSYSGNSNTSGMKFYLDGALQSTIAFANTLTNSIATTGALTAGFTSGSYNSGVGITLDDIQIFRGVELTQSDFKRLMLGLHPLQGG